MATPAAAITAWDADGKPVADARVPQAQPQAQPQQDQGAQDRAEALSGMTGMPVAGQNAQQFQSGKTAGMVSGLATAGAVAAAPFAADAAGLAKEYAEFFGKEGAKKLIEMAQQHPEATKAIVRIVGGALAGHEIGHTSAGALVGLLSSTLK